MRRQSFSTHSDKKKLWLTAGACLVVLFTFMQCSTKNPSVGSYTQYHLPSSIEFAGKKVPLNDPKTYERIDTAFQLLVHDQRGQTHVWLKRLGKYKHILEAQLEKENVHKDFVYLAVKESSLRPCPVSSASAKGIWQFIEGTAERYNLVINDTIDERCDIYKATTAAAQYLNDLLSEKYFKGDPFLAMAAYNDGEIDVLNMIRIQQNTNKDLGYFSSFTNSETGGYVPGIIALKIVLSDPEKYGFEPTYDYETFDVVTVNQSFSQDIAIGDIVRAIGMDYLDFKTYNPHLKIYYTEKNILPAGNQFQIYLPEEYVENFKAFAS